MIPKAFLQCEITNAAEVPLEARETSTLRPGCCSTLQARSSEVRRALIDRVCGVPPPPTALVESLDGFGRKTCPIQGVGNIVSFGCAERRVGYLSPVFEGEKKRKKKDKKFRKI